MTEPLFQPYQLGDLSLPNRMIMAPLTRSRANRDHVIQPITGTYYAQRATAGLIISEATNISPQAVGYAWTPGIWSEHQTRAWTAVVEQVHQAGGRIFSQLWHCGRTSHPDVQGAFETPVAPSAVRQDGEAFTYEGFKPHPTPRALEAEEIEGVIRQYVRAADNAKRAGFDGIEIHAANGYLLAQFLADKTNKRTDGYGGSIENRTRLVLEVVDAVAQVWPSARIGLRLSPNTDFGDISDSDPEPLYGHLVDQLAKRGLAYLHMVEDFPGMSSKLDTLVETDALGRRFGGTYMVNGGYDRARGMDKLASGRADLICYGRPFLANPDLVDRFRLNAPLNQPDPSTFYGGTERGYTDYPFLNRAAA
ncbi:MAG: alkene reductase [Rhodothalassiaceae bacterium]